MSIFSEMNKNFSPRSTMSWGSHVADVAVADLSVTGEHTGKSGYHGFFNRPRSVLTRPQSAASEIDPDHEPISDVLSRLGDYTHNFTPEVSLANTECDCKSHDKRASSRLAKVYDSDDDGSSSDDDEGTTMSLLLKMLQQLDEKGSSTAKYRAVMTLVSSYTGEEVLSVEQLDQMMRLLQSGQSATQEACLHLLKQTARTPANVSQLLDLNILDFVYDCVASEESASLSRPALLLLQALFSHGQYKDDWIDTANTEFLPLLLSVLNGPATLDVKYTACCVFRALAVYDEFIPNVTSDILPAILLLRSPSTKFKEVYVEILTDVISHTNCIPPDLVDSSAIPITVSIIREGPCEPQCAALHLLASLTNSDSGVSMVIHTNSLVAMVMCCLKESHCRKVRVNAAEVMKNLSSSRKLGLCKDLMLHISSYLVPLMEPDSITSLSQLTDPKPGTISVKPVFDEERRMWTGLEKFMEMIKNIIFREGKVETDELGLMTRVHMKPCVDVYPDQLALISHSLGILQNLCLWPLDKSRLGFSANKIDLTSFTDDDRQRARLSKVNRGLTQAVWDKVGGVVTDVLGAYSNEVSKTLQNQGQGKQLFQLETIFEQSEIDLINSLLSMLLCASICTCVAFPELLPKLEHQSPKRHAKNKLKSSSSPNVPSDSTSSGIRSDVKLSSKSDVGHGLNAGDRLWVNDNPHLTSLDRHTSPPQAVVEAQKADLRHKEACTDRRLLRRCLYESGVFFCVCPFLKCHDQSVQVTVLQILRCLIQPLEERLVPKPPVRMSGQGSRRQRPHTAATSRETEKKLNVALSQMSPELAELIGDALGPRGQTARGGPASDKTVSIPGIPHSLETIHERLQEYTETVTEQGDVNSQGPVKVKRSKPAIDMCRPIAQQCREMVLEEIGQDVVGGIFTKAADVKKLSVLLLHDLVHYGEVETHMELSQYGCMPKLLDFLRVNEDDELLEIIGLIVVRMLVSSDARLKQLFNRHGGPGLLLAMAQYTSGLLKQEVAHTLKTVTRDVPIKKRPCSAPAGRVTTVTGATDVWEHIQRRWKQEDQVKKVLRQWIK